MRLDNDIEYAMKGILKNPILVLLRFVYMLIINKRQSSFVKQNSDAYGKDTYYRFIQSKCYNWKKLLLLRSQVLIEKVEPLQKIREPKLLINR